MQKLWTDGHLIAMDIDSLTCYQPARCAAGESLTAAPRLLLMSAITAADYPWVGIEDRLAVSPPFRTPSYQPT